MKKHGIKKKKKRILHVDAAAAAAAAADWHGCVGNGPERGAGRDGSDEVGEDSSSDSGSSMELGARQKQRRDRDDLGGSASGNERVKRARGTDERERVEFKVILRFGEEKGISGMNPVRLTAFLKEKVGDIRMAKILRDGNLLIVCGDEKQRERAERITEIGRSKVVNSSRSERGGKGAKGVIWGVPSGVTMEEIKANLLGGVLKSALRLQVTRGGVREDSESVLLEFEEEILPMKVTLGYLSYSVREYVPKPMRCYNCQRFGHTAKYCKGKRRCPKCGEDHEFKDCRQEQPKCCSCGGSHSVAYGGCEVMKKEVLIQQVRTQNKTTYAEAVKMVKQREGQGGRVEGSSEAAKTQTAERREIVADQASKGKVLVDVRKLVTFIAGVVNVTTEVKSKTERIQRIVKAANYYLDTGGLTWEEVNTNLSSQESQEHAWAGV